MVRRRDEPDAAGGRPRSPYAGARVEELEEPLLPRWFVLLAVALVPTAIGVVAWAFLAFGPEEVPVAERRPPPAEGLSTAVGELNVGELDPIQVPAACQVVEGIRAGGSATDRARIQLALDALCGISLPEPVAQGLRAFGRQGGVVRFAQFAATGVDSTLDVGTEPVRVLVNARLARPDTDATWIAPLLVHDTTYLLVEPGSAAAALQARQAEATVCSRLFTDSRPSRACDDADALLALPDPLAALREAGFG